MINDDGDIYPIKALPSGVSVKADGYTVCKGMTFDEVLLELLSMNGKWAKITILGLIPFANIAEFEGRIKATENILHPSRRAKEGEALAVLFEDQPHQLMIPNHAFVCAGYCTLASMSGVLTIAFGTTVVHIDTRPTSERD